MPITYKTFAEYLSEKFPAAHKIQKIGVTTGFSCPNRDGTIGVGGCAYCNNSSFTPDYVGEKSEGRAVDRIRASLQRGKAFFARKYPSMQYLAYFQSYTNTHGAGVDELMEMYECAAAEPGIIGVIIGTRPDCVADDLLDRLQEMNRRIPVMLEFGAESSHNQTLSYINRGHTWEDVTSAVIRSNRRDIDCGLHFIMGLPGEDEDMMLQTVLRAVDLPIKTLKFHQLQIIRGTRFETEYEQNPERFRLFTPEDYAALCRKIISIVSPTSIAIDRFVSQSPDSLLIAPRWGLKNYQFANLL